MEMKAKLPSFMDRTKRFGSIGWGVKRDELLSKPFHNKSVEWTENSTTNSSLALNTSFDLDTTQQRLNLGSNKVICKDRFHIRDIEKNYDTIGSWGFLNMDGNFTSAIDKKLKMERRSFYLMNMSFQRKYVKEIAQATPFYKSSNVTLRSGKESNTTTHKARFPNLKELIDNPGKQFFTVICNLFLGNKTLVGFEKWRKFSKWQEKHTPFRLEKSSPKMSRSTRRSTNYQSTMHSRVNSIKSQVRNSSKMK